MDDVVKLAVLRFVCRYVYIWLCEMTSKFMRLILRLKTCFLLITCHLNWHFKNIPTKYSTSNIEFAYFVRYRKFKKIYCLFLLCLASTMNNFDIYSKDISILELYLILNTIFGNSCFLCMSKNFVWNFQTVFFLW